MTASSSIRNLLECVSDAAVVVGRSGAIHMANDRAARLLRRSEPELTEVPLASLIDGPAADTLLQGLAAGEASRHASGVRLFLPEGGLSVAVRVSVRSLGDADDEGSAVVLFTEETDPDTTAILASVAERTTDAYLVFDGSGVVVEANAAAVSLLGYEREDLLGRARSDIDPLSAGGAPLESGRETGRLGVVSESLHRRRDGTLIPVDVSTTLITRGERAYRLVCIRDASIRRSAEAALATSERRYQALFNGLLEASLLVFVHSPDAPSEECVAADVNPSFEALFGVDRSKVVGQPVSEVLPGPWDRWLEECRRVIESGAPARFEDYLSESERHLVVSVLDLGNGHCAMTFVDETERKRTEEALENRTAVLERILDDVPGYVFLKDAQGHYVRTSLALARIYGLKRRDIEGQDYLGISGDPEEHQRIVEEESALLARPLGDRMETRRKLIDAAGAIHWIQVTKSTLRLAHEDTPYVLGVGVDITEKVELEEHLRQSEARLRTIVENVGDLIYSVSRQGVLTYVSPSWGASMGHDPDELVGRRLLELVHREDAEALERFIENTFRRKTVQSGVEFRLLHRDGRWIWHTSTASAARNGNDSATLVVGVARDVSERKMAEEALIEQRAFLSELIDLIPGHIYVKDTDGRFVLVNRAMAEFYDRTPESIVGEILDDLLDDEEGATAVREESDRVLALEPGEVFSTIRRGRNVHGENRWLQIYKRPVFNADGSPQGLMGVSIDISDLVEAEAAVREAEARLRAILDAARQIIYTLSPDGQFTFVSPACRRVLGYEVDELLGRHYSDLIHPGDRPRLMEFVASVVQGHGTAEASEFRLRRKDGTWSWFTTSGAPLPAPEGSPTGLVGVADDVSERKFIEDELRIAHAELEERVARRTEELREANEALTRENAERTRAEHALEHRLLVLTQPDIDVGLFALTDVIDLPFLEKLRNEFARYSGLDSWIVGTRGESILASATTPVWALVAGDKAGSDHGSCASATDLESLAETRAVECTPAGVLCGLVPIVVGPAKVATWVVGQVVCEDYDEEKARDQARKAGIDEERLLAEVDRLPRMSRAGFQRLLGLLTSMVEQLSLLALQNLQQARLITQRKEAEKALREAHDRLEEMVQERTAELSRANRSLRQEISGRIVMESRLRQSESALEQTQRIAHVGGWQWSFGEQNLVCSDETWRIFGREPNSDGFDVRDFLRAVHPDDRRLVEGAFNRAIEHLRSFDFSCRIVTPGGEERIVHQLGEVGRDADGVAAVVLGTVRDITDAAMAEADLEWESSVNAAAAALSSSLMTARSLAQISQLVLQHACSLSGSPLGYVGYVDYEEATLVCPAVTGGFWADRDGPRTLATDGMTALTGWSLEHREPVVSNDVASDERLPLEEEEHHIRKIVSVPAMLGDGLVGQLTLANAYLDYGDRDVDMLQRFAALYALAIERRRAEEDRKKLEAQIQHAQKLESLGVLAGGIAHDFNNLLVGILGNADLALLDMPDASPARPWVEEIRKAGLRASDLTNQMLAYSGKGQFIIERVSLNALVEEMSHLLRMSVSKSAVLNYNLAPDLPMIEGDATQLRQIVMNLILNASDALGEKSGVISISTGVIYADSDYLTGPLVDEALEEGDYVFLEVADTGCGMDEATLGRIFDPFFTTKFTGRGLGLAAVLGIIRGHAGTAKVDSVPGEGTVFRVLFPSRGRSAAEQKPAPGGGSEAWSGAGTVLIVDDEESVRTVASTILRKYGFATLTAPGGAEGVRILRERGDEIVLVILDMTMGDMDGVATFREMVAIREDVKVVLASGYSEIEALGRFPEEGLRGFIQKPFQMKDLIGAVKRALEE